MNRVLWAAVILVLPIIGGCGSGKEEPTSPTSPEAKVPRYKVSTEFKNCISEVLLNYFEVHTALTEDDLGTAKAATRKLKNSTDKAAKLDRDNLSEEERKEWEKSLANLSDSASQLLDVEDIEGTRNVFVLLSDSVINTVKNFGHSQERAVQLCHCGMKRAYWLQKDSGEPIRNPYFGKDMLD